MKFQNGGTLNSTLMKRSFRRYENRILRWKTGDFFSLYEDNRETYKW